MESISNETGMSIANTSRHLQILKDGNLVISEKNGNYVVAYWGNGHLNSEYNDDYIEEEIESIIALKELGL